MGYSPPGAPTGDGFAQTCNQWSQPSSIFKRNQSPSQVYYTDSLQYTLSPYYQSPSSFSFPSTLKLFVHAGPAAASSGTFTVTTDDTLQAPLVDVTIKYKTTETWNSTEVCLMRTFDSVGLGIYVSRRSYFLDCIRGKEGSR